MIAWATATLAAALAYLLSSMVSLGKLYSPLQLIYGLLLESAVAAVPVFLVGLLLTILIIRFHLSIYTAMAAFVLFGAICGGLVFDYLAGGTAKDWLAGGALPGAVGGFAFVMAIRLTRLAIVDGRE